MLLLQDILLAWITLIEIVKKHVTEEEEGPMVEIRKGSKSKLNKK